MTLNLGLRYEYYGPMKDPEHRLSRFLDLNAPIPEFQGANTPQLPAAATALRTSAPDLQRRVDLHRQLAPRFMEYSQDALPAPHRHCLAYQRQTALRAGFARYIIPATLTDGLNILGSVPYPGFDATSNTVAPLLGVPQQTLADPFPGGLVPVTGKGFGTYTNLGGAATWYKQDFTQRSERPDQRQPAARPARQDRCRSSLTSSISGATCRTTGT